MHKIIVCGQGKIFIKTMNFTLLCIYFTLISSNVLFAQQQSDIEYFQKLVGESWKEKFYSSGSDNWEEKWFLDGNGAEINNDDKGMEFDAGSKKEKSNLNHAVLWTKEHFKGDIKIEYEYIRLDSAKKFTTILYVQATGSGHGIYDKDIYRWADLRTVPHMKLYFNHMNTYHISYAAYGNKGYNPENDYIRARRYLPETLKGIKGTAMKPDYKRTGLFKTGVPHKIIVIKKGNDLLMYIRNSEKDFLCIWKNQNLPPILEGRIGLRHMSTRAARYRHFRISVLQSD